MIFKPFLINPTYINEDSSNWSGNFTSKYIPHSSLSPLVPGNNVLAARASALKGGSSKKNNMRVYNRMRRHRHTKKCKINHKRKSVGRGKSMRRSLRRNRSIRGGLRNTAMTGGNAGIKDWIIGNSLNNTSYSMPFKYLSPQLSALANPTPFVNKSHNL